MDSTDNLTLRQSHVYANLRLTPDTHAYESINQAGAFQPKVVKVDKTPSAPDVIIPTTSMQSRFHQLPPPGITGLANADHPNYQHGTSNVTNVEQPSDHVSTRKAALTQTSCFRYVKPAAKSN